MTHHCPYCHLEVTPDQPRITPQPGWCFHWGCYHHLLADEQWVTQYEPETVLLGEEQ